MAVSRSALALLFASCLALQTDQAAQADAAAAAAPAVSASYLVHPGDTLQVSVWREPELQGEVLVRPDGGMTFPLAGEIQAAGHSVDDIRQVLQTRVAKFVPDPVVTVVVKKADGNRFFVVGKVNRPGDFALYGSIDVMQALSAAGGTTPFADVNGIRILRREGERQQVFRFRYDDVRRGRDLASNIVLHSGDTVVVP